MEKGGLISEALTSNWLLWKARSCWADSYGAWLPTCPSRDHRTQASRLMKENKFNQKGPSGSREFVAHRHALGPSAAYSRLRSASPGAARTMKPGRNSPVYLCLLSLAFPGCSLNSPICGPNSLHKFHLQHLENKKGKGFWTTKGFGCGGPAREIGVSSRCTGQYLLHCFEDR